MMWRVETNHSLRGFAVVIAEEIGDSPGVFPGGLYGVEARIGASKAQIRAVARRLRAGGHKVAVTRIHLGEDDGD
jgi:hypothetical protein